MLTVNIVGLAPLMLYTEMSWAIKKNKCFKLMFLLDNQQLALLNISFTLSPNLILVSLHNHGEW